MQKIWKDIKGYEGLYQVSNLGDVKSKKAKIMKPKNEKNYLKLYLCKNGKKKTKYIHRIYL